MRFWLLIAATLTISAAPPTPTRMYVVGCGGQIDTVDTTSGVRLRTVDVARELPIKRSQTIAGATFDGCLLNQALYDPTHAAFYSSVPDQFSDKADGTKNYHVFRFTVPELRATQLFASGQSVDAAPELRLTPHGTVQVERATLTALNLSGFTQAAVALPNQIIEESGNIVLLRLFGPKQLSLAVVDLQHKHLTQLEGLPATTALNVHLAPGGVAVYVEEVTAPPRKTGRAFVFDAASGKEIKLITNSRIATASFLALTPDGHAVYHSGGQFYVIALSAMFGIDVVVSPSKLAGPAIFFAAR